MDIVFLSSIEWTDQGGAHRPPQLSRALAGQGHRILFVQLLPSEPSSPHANISLTSLYELGLSETAIRRAWFGFHVTNLEYVAQNLAARLDQFEQAADRAVIWTHPFPPFVNLLPLFQSRGYKTVYDCMDEWQDADRLGLYFANPRAEDFLMRQTDLILVAVADFVERFQKLLPATRIGLVRNSLDPGLLRPPSNNPAPDDLVRGELTLGYWGTFQDYTFDFETVESIARARPQWAFNLIGEHDLPRSPQTAIQRLSALPNVRFFGFIPNERLFDYARHFDVLLMPYPDNTFSRGRDSSKLYSYVASAKPIVALRASQLAFAPNIFLAETAEEFLAQIENARNYRVNLEAAQDFIREHTWDNSARKLALLIQELPRSARNTNGMVLNQRFANPDNESQRLNELTVELEKIAEERRVYALRVQAYAQEMVQRVQALERTHPRVWLERACHKTRPPR